MSEEQCEKLAYKCVFHFAVLQDFSIFYPSSLRQAMSHQSSSQVSHTPLLFFAFLDKQYIQVHFVFVTCTYIICSVNQWNDSLPNLNHASVCWHPEKFEHMKKTGDYYVVVVEDTNAGQIVATATLITEHKFIHSCAKVTWQLPSSACSYSNEMFVSCMQQPHKKG